jgi:hypothetical protein
LNHLGYSLCLHDPAALIWGPGVISVTALAVTAPLSGTISFTGIVDPSGAATPWSLPPGTPAGVYQAPGSRSTGGGFLSYSMTDPGDADKVLGAWNWC